MNAHSKRVRYMFQTDTRVFLNSKGADGSGKKPAPDIDNRVSETRFEIPEETNGAERANVRKGRT